MLDGVPDEGRADSLFKTFPLAVFLRNLFCESGRSSRARLSMMIGG